MDTQRRHMTKTNKVIVPFYSTPVRHYGQTPAEIIREARASMMSLQASGIKPLLTNRPFTPKEKERTLFGNIKKKFQRPTSSFSLGYLHNPDSLPRLKLPAIASDSPQKVDRNSSYPRPNSLENLIEEYEAEVSEGLKETSTLDFPVFCENHSSSQVGAMVRSVSLKERLSSQVPEKRSVYTISHKSIEDAVPYFEGNTYVDSSKGFKQGSLDFCNRKRFSPKRHGLLDEASFLLEDNGKVDVFSQIQPSLLNKSLDSINVSGVDTNFNKDVVYEANNNENNGNREKAGGISSSDCESNDVDVVHEALNGCDQSSDKLCEEKIISRKGLMLAKPDEPFDNKLGEKDFGKDKCTSTEFQSEYLSLVNNRPRSVTINDNGKPKEIQELYETAAYYGVTIEDKTKMNKSFEKSHFKGILDSKDSKESMTTDYLRTMKENIKNFDEKMKQLNHSIESLEEKLMTNNVYYSNEVLKNYKSESKTSDRVEFKMNEEKRYHINLHEKHKVVEDRPKSAKGKQQTVGWDGFWKSSYYKTQDTESDSSCEKYYLEKLEPYIAQFNKVSHLGCESREIAALLKEFYTWLKNEDLFQKNIISSDNKIKILRSLYNFADKEDPEILLSLARIIFGLRVDSSLSAACKMVFKVARSDENDNLFLKIDDILELFLEGIGLASPLDAAESCIYGYGAIKFLTMNHRILSRLTNLGVLDLLILHLKIINSAKLEGHIVNEQSMHALFQLTGALRNIAAGDGVLPLFISTNSIPVLCDILMHFRSNEDLITNISRILSLLSTDENVIQVLMSVGNVLEIVTDLIEEYKANDKILIRLSYCLGNIVAYNDLARIQLSRSEASMTILLKVLQFYMDKDLEMSMKDDKKSEGEEMDADTVDDIIVKVIRIIANMCINPVVGSYLAPSGGQEKISSTLSQLLTILLQRKDPGITLLACLGCLNNVSYYCSNHSSLIDIAAGVIRILGLPDEDCQAEAATVLGNLTRHKEIRELLCNTGGVAQLTSLLETKNKEVYKSACGAIVNLMLDSETRKSFIESRGIDKLVLGLEKFSGDWSFAGLICRALWNSCADDLEEVMSHNDLERLVNILANSLDEENCNDGDTVWEEFAFLATDLLEKINAYLECL